MQKARRHPRRGSDRSWAHGFRYSFTPRPGVLFTFPSRYWFAIGLPGVFSLAGWSRPIRAGVLVPRPTQGPGRGAARFAYGALTPYGAAFQPLRLAPWRPLRRPYYPGRAATRPVWAPPRSLAATGGITVVFSSSGYWDVSVRRVRPPSRGCRAFRPAGCPIRAPPGQRPCAPRWGLSRLAAPFIASGSHRHPPCALPHFPRARAARHPCPRPARGPLPLCRPPRGLGAPAGGARRLKERRGECRARTGGPRLAKPVLYPLS